MSILLHMRLIDQTSFAASVSSYIGKYVYPKALTVLVVIVGPPWLIRPKSPKSDFMGWVATKIYR